MFTKTLTTEFQVVGPERGKKFFPYIDLLPKPGQWIYLESASQGVSRFMAQIATVDLTLINKNLYQVKLEINRASLKEDILFAKLARQQFDQVDRQSELLEPINFTETITRTEGFNITVVTVLPGYSNQNYSNGEYSEP